MTRRKMILIASCVALLCVYIMQLVMGNRSGAKTYKLEGQDEIDMIKISKADGEFTINKEGDGWTVSGAKYPAAEAVVDGMLSQIKEIKILDTVGKASAENSTRYETGGGKELTVTAESGGKVLRTITVGKSSSTSSQTYIIIDGGHDVCLASGNLRQTFNKSVDDIRSRLIYKLDQDKLRKVFVTYNGETLSYEKAADSPEWKSADGTPAGNSSKLSSWASSLYSASASKWLDDDAVLPAEPIATARIESEDDFASIKIYKAEIVNSKAEEASANDYDSESASQTETKYYCTSSATAYKAELSSYVAEKYLKQASDFDKAE